jgi:hypothetical protein
MQDIGVCAGEALRLAEDQPRKYVCCDTEMLVEE